MQWKPAGVSDVVHEVLEAGGIPSIVHLLPGGFGLLEAVLNGRGFALEVQLRGIFSVALHHHRSEIRILDLEALSHQIFIKNAQLR